MIKNTLKDKQVHLSIDNMDFSFRIPVKKIGNTVDWRIGEKGTEGIVMKQVSTWALQLFTKKITEEKYVLDFKSIVQEHAPSNVINWDLTIDAVNLQNDYNQMIAVDEKLSEEEIIAILKKKYKLD